MNSVGIEREIAHAEERLTAMRRTLRQLDREIRRQRRGNGDGLMDVFDRRAEAANEVFALRMQLRRLSSRKRILEHSVDRHLAAAP